MFPFFMHIKDKVRRLAEEEQRSRLIKKQRKVLEEEVIDHITSLGVSNWDQFTSHSYTCLDPSGEIFFELSSGWTKEPIRGPFAEFSVRIYNSASSPNERPVEIAYLFHNKINRRLKNYFQKLSEHHGL